jgi:hypothetical protein
MISRLLACGLLLMLGGCNLFKKNDDPLPPPPVSAVAITPTSIAPEIPVSSSVVAVTPPAASAPNPAAVVPAGEHSKGSANGPAPVAKKGGTAPTAPGASAAPADPDGPATPSSPSLGFPTISKQCQSGCQKSYQDCTTQSGAANAIEMVQKCAAALSACFASCK